MRRALRHLLFAQAAIFIGTTQAARFIMIRTMPRPLPTSSTSMAMPSLGTAANARDVQLVAMERAAWNAGCRVGTGWQVTVDDELIESSLDTYRDWLHARSRCPHCNATGLQRSDGTYTCLACFTHWRANSATTCQLRRYVVKNTMI